MTDLPMEDMDRTQQEREADKDEFLEKEGEILERDQRGKGYGEDEGEREGALPE